MKGSILLFLVLFLSACSSNLSFNQRYQAAGWDSVLVAPFQGEDSGVAEKYFEHHLAVSSQVKIISPRAVKQLLVEADLSQVYEKNPQEAIFELARQLDVDGVIFSELTTKTPAQSIGPQLNQTSVSLYVNLLDAKNKTSVASSLHDSKSVFSGTESLIQDVTEDAVKDFEQFFVMVK